MNGLCKDHFVEYFEETVKNTIEEYGLIKPTDKIVVAVSGGKDSITLLYILNKLYDNVEGLCINEGISGYRDLTLEKLRGFCKEHSIKLNVHSYVEEFGNTLDHYMGLVGKFNAKHPENRVNLKPCTVCGIFRRYMINKYSEGFDKSATGHNLDDESQAVLMNLLKNQIPILARFGPMTGVDNDSMFIPRIKPLYFLSEKEILTYSLIKGFNLIYNECPYVPEAFRANVRDELNKIEKETKVKKNILLSYLKISKDLKEKYSQKVEKKYCTKCGAPTNRLVCNRCEMIEKLNEMGANL